MARVMIEHPKTGMRFGIEREDFGKKMGMEKSYEEQGYKVISYEDGTELESPRSSDRVRPSSPARSASTSSDSEDRDVKDSEAGAAS